MKSIVLLVLLVVFVAGSAQPKPATAVVETNKVASDSLLMDVGEVLDDLLRVEPYIYQNSSGRDPFVALLTGEDEIIDMGDPSVEDLIVVGILWGSGDRFAMVETRRGRSLILRKGDPVRNGYVLAVHPDGIEVQYSHYGVVQKIMIPVTSGVEEKDER
jgi:hypothetical protein